MHVQPPEPMVSSTERHQPRRLSYLMVMLAWFGIVLVVMLVAWLMLWGGVLEEPAGTGTDTAPGEVQRP